MNIVTLDFETYFDDEYSLKKMTLEAYVRDPRFKVLGCAMRWPDGKTEWRYGHDDRKFANWIHGNKVAVLAHHAQFDGLILSHHYGVKPHAWLDTLSMARLLLGNHVSVSLDSLARHYALAAKNVPYNLFKGKHWGELPQDVQRQVSDGAIHDVELTWQIFNILAKTFPPEEYRTIDTTIRMFTEPVLEGDIELLGHIWTEEDQAKKALLVELGVTNADLQSADKFGELLRAEGVEPRTKEGKNGPIPAFAATDDFMQELIDDENPRVALLAQARLEAKSTIGQSRAARMGWMASRGPLPVYLNYCGAHTTRWSGGDKLNFQNPPPKLKAAIMAPPGYKLGIVDASQIECRLLNFVAGQDDKIEEFRAGKDPYVGVAEEFCGHPVTKESHPQLRQAGKVVELQAGFGSGGGKIRSTLKNKAGIIITIEDGERYKHAYRDTHPKVVDYWKQGNLCIERMGNFLSYEWGVLQVVCDPEKETRRIVLPNGAQLIYDTLEWHTTEEGDRYWRIKTRKGWVKLYGAKLIENIIQALARVLVGQAMNRITAAGISVVMMTHDDIVACLPDDSDISSTFEFIKEEMKREPDWLPNIPLDCEGVLSERYEK